MKLYSLDNEFIEETHLFPDNFTGIIENVYGTKYWYLNGKIHRTDGPACELPNRTKYWYLNGVLHREDGPAIEHLDGTKFWYLDSQLHRIGGPAIENTTGYKVWYFNGKQMSEEQHKLYVDVLKLKGLL